MGLDMDGAASQFGDPFRCGPGSYYEWLNSPAENMQGDPPVSRLWYAVYQSRPDLKAAYPALPGIHQSAFNTWCGVEGTGQMGIDAASFPAGVDDDGKPAGKASGARSLLAKVLWSPARAAATAVGRVGIKNPRILAGLYYIRKGIDHIFQG
jgi:hypothetical protein